MERQTAVEYAVQWLTPFVSVQQKYIDELLKEAKEMEKKQIVEAFYQGADQESDTHGAQNLDMKDAENYYNETFKTK
jgi:hypothetical protein